MSLLVSLFVPFIALFLILNISPNYASNILFFHLWATHSHRTSIWPLAEKLADKGHNITYIFPLPRNKDNLHPAIEEITPSKMFSLIEEHVNDYDINLRLNNSNHLKLQLVFELSFDMCVAFYESPEIQEWMRRPNLHYDLVMIDSSMGECIYGLVNRFQAKHVIFVPALLPNHWDGFGLVPESSSIPPSIVFLGKPPKPSEMNFFGRLWATLEHLVWRLGYWDYLGKVERLIIERMNMTDLPPLENFERNASLVLINTHFVNDYPLALPPMFQSYSGLWCSKEKIREQKPLPNDLSKFVEDQDSDGFIYVSFGSAASPATMPLDVRNVFFDSIAAFPKLRFLWKWSGSLPEKTPDNLLLRQWFPQNDILLHPKIKGFITQAGRPSTSEAFCHGVPMITIPIFADQDYNADRLEQIGVAINIEIQTISKGVMIDAIRDLAYDAKMKTKMAKLSAMFKDRPVDPLDNTLYWTEYVLRHDTSLMKPLGIKQSWFQRRLLDVYLVITGVTLTVVVIVVLLVLLALKYAKRIVSKMTTRGKQKRKSD